MFRRRRARSADFDLARGPDADGPRDEMLTMLSVSQAQALVWLALHWFHDTEREAHYVGDGSIASEGTRFGLHNLGVAVAERPWADWPQIVSNHFVPLLAAPDEPPPLELDSIYLKLRMATDLPEQPDYDALSPLPGIHALFALDTPTMVHEFVRVEALTPLGDLAAARDRAVQNLRALPLPDHRAVQADPDRDDADVHLFTGDDFFVASRLLTLPELLEAVGVRDAGHGVLVAAPNRHLLCVHVVGGLGVIGAVNLLAQLAEGEHGAAGSMSDEVYYLPPDGAGQIVTRRDDDGTVNVTVDGALADTFGRLGLIG